MISELGLLSKHMTSEQPWPKYLIYRHSNKTKLTNMSPRFVFTPTASNKIKLMITCTLQTVEFQALPAVSQA